MHFARNDRRDASSFFVITEGAGGCLVVGGMTSASQSAVRGDFCMRTKPSSFGSHPMVGAAEDSVPSLHGAAQLHSRLSIGRTVGPP